MKRDSYVASGYKYGLLNYPNEIFREFLDREFEMDDNGLVRNSSESSHFSSVDKYKHIVPFESVDGLELCDLKDYGTLVYKGEYIVFVMHDEIPNRLQKEVSRNKWIYMDPENRGYIRYTYLIDIYKYRDSDATIDEVIEEHLLSNMDKLSISNKRRALGFLEKYIVGDKDDTNMIIVDYLNRHKSEYSDDPLHVYAKLPDRLINKNK